MIPAHLPLRPVWTCVCCGECWPCRARRTELLTEFDGATALLGMMMTAHFIRAAEDLPTVPAGQLYARFVGWVHSRPPRPVNAGHFT